MDLSTLSIEDLKILQNEITSLIKEKFVPKYKEETCFINPKSLFFLCIHCVYDDIDNDKCYRVVINHFNGDNYIRNVNESFIDECLVISKETYYLLISNINEIKNKLNTLGYKQRNEFYNYEKSLNNEFKEKLQKVINEYKTD